MKVFLILSILCFFASVSSLRQSSKINWNRKLYLNKFKRDVFMDMKDKQKRQTRHKMGSQKKKGNFKSPKKPFYQRMNFTDMRKRYLDRLHRNRYLRNKYNKRPIKFQRTSEKSKKPK